MIVTDLQVTKLKHGLFHVDCRVLRLGNPLLTEVDRWEYECPDLVVVQAVCMSYMKREVLYVVGKDSWLHRCRTARPGSVVLSVRWDGSSGDKRPAVPRKWVSHSYSAFGEDDLVILENGKEFSLGVEWHNLPFIDQNWMEHFREWVSGEKLL
jgi:hypothetical protein